MGSLRSVLMTNQFYCRFEGGGRKQRPVILVGSGICPDDKGPIRPRKAVDSRTDTERIATDCMLNMSPWNVKTHLFLG